MISFIEAILQNNGVAIKGNTIFNFKVDGEETEELVSVDPLGNALLSAGFIPEPYYDIGGAYEKVYEFWPDTKNHLAGIQNMVQSWNAHMDARHFVSMYWDTNPHTKKTIKSIVQILRDYGIS